MEELEDYIDYILVMSNLPLNKITDVSDDMVELLNRIKGDNNIKISYGDRIYCGINEIIVLHEHKDLHLSKSKSEVIDTINSKVEIDTIFKNSFNGGDICMD